MEKTPFALTLEQQGLLASLALNTDEPIPALLAEALQKLQVQERLARRMTTAQASRPHGPGKLASPSGKPSSRPTDLAAQVDRYVYGTPKRVAMGRFFADTFYWIALLY